MASPRRRPGDNFRSKSAHAGAALFFSILEQHQIMAACAGALFDSAKSESTKSNTVKCDAKMDNAAMDNALDLLAGAAAAAKPIGQSLGCDEVMLVSAQ